MAVFTGNGDCLMPRVGVAYPAGGYHGSPAAGAVMFLTSSGSLQSNADHRMHSKPTPLRLARTIVLLPA
eukprot:2041736-Rhodomonas_salina.3